MDTFDPVVVRPENRRAQQALEALLARAGIALDKNLDYSLGLVDQEGKMVATGSAYRGTLRCMAVDQAYQGQGLLARVLTSLLERQVEMGYLETFLYTKCETARFFGDLGFYEIERVPGRVVFMSNRRNAFRAYLSSLEASRASADRIASVVMNANPFTLGHLALLERAARENDVVECFVVSEDVSLIPFDVRFDLVRAGCAALPNVRLHPSGNYIVSSATFPSYFLKDQQVITQAHARLDIRIFGHIARALGITRRYVGEEPFSAITQIYNDIMALELPQCGVQLTVMARAAGQGGIISASRVRQYLHDGALAAIRPFVPATTYAFFESEKGQAIVRRIQEASRVVHD
ncbi:MAG: [citrate (pro-3S)-lyase] ligase [Clostridia bacterium]